MVKSANDDNNDNDYDNNYDNTNSCIEILEPSKMGTTPPAAGLLTLSENHLSKLRTNHQFVVLIDKKVVVSICCSIFFGFQQSAQKSNMHIN